MRYMKKSKVNTIMVLIIFEVVNVFITLLYDAKFYTSTDIRLISIVAVCEFICTFFLWKKISGEYISAFSITYLVAILFCSGQSICWAFGLDMGDINLQTYIPNIGMDYIGNSLLYTLNGLILFFIGGILSYPDEDKFYFNESKSPESILSIKSINTVSSLLLIISIPCVIVNYVNILPSIIAYGYVALYSEMEGYSQMGQFIPLIASWFPIALLMKYIVGVNMNKNKAKVAAIFLFIHIAITLFIGGRSGAVMICLAFVLAKQYFGKPIQKKSIIPVFILGYIFMGLLNTIADVRLEAGRTVLSIFSAFSLSSILGNFIGELGWSMSSLAWTMRLLENGSYFRHGKSYLYALTAIIPNLGFWEVHPSIVANLGDWMQDSLGRSTGLGYTFVAETYANFSWWGLLTMFLIGIIIGKIMNRVSRVNARYNYKYSLLVIMIISTILKSFVRSSFSAIMRQLFFTVILIYILTIIVERIYIRKGDIE